MADAGERLGLLLQKAGIISETQLNDAVEVHKATGSPIGRVLVDLGYASQKAVLKVVAAQVGIAEAAKYPSISLFGTVGLADSDLSLGVGPSVTWPIFNYGRIKNNVRVQDARLQQALVNYREIVLQAAREAEDAMAGFIGSNFVRSRLSSGDEITVLDKLRQDSTVSCAKIDRGAAGRVDVCEGCIVEEA